MDTILRATDGLKSSAQALDFAIELASEHRSNLVIAHVVRTPIDMGDDLDDGELTDGTPTSEPSMAGPRSSMLPQRRRGATSTSVRFDPATDTFGDGPSIPHCVENATLLANGDVLVSGFWPATGNADAVAWAGVLDPPRARSPTHRRPTGAAHPRSPLRTEESY